MTSLLTTVTALVHLAAQVPEDQAPLPAVEVDFTLGSVLVALFWACLFAIPLGVSIWALLDAAKRPRWVWALAGRRQVVWMAVILGGILSVVGGLLISGWYLTRVRPHLAAVEDGRFDLD